MKSKLIDELPHLRAYALSLCRNADRADDLVQDTMVKAISKSHQFKEGTNLRAWLFTILRNSFITAARKSGRETAMPENADDFLVGAPGNQQQSIEFDDFVRALHTLRPHFREVLLLVGAAGFDYATAASITGTEIGTVKSRVSRARHKLTRMLKDGDRLPSRSASKSTFSELETVMRAGTTS